MFEGKMILGRTLISAILISGFALVADSHRANADAFVVGSTLCKPNFKKWTRWKGWKAFALNKIKDNKQVCGWSSGASSKNEAIKIAMSFCRKYEKQRPVFGIPNTCYLYRVSK
jgi:hypothetical protein